MLNKNKWKQYGQEGLVVKCITIHNTNNYDMSAKELFEYLNKNNLTSQGCHYLIDYNDIIEVMPLTWKTWHTGKGNDYAFHNSIAIEICSNINDDLYLNGQDKAIALIKELMKKYNLTKDDLYFHKDFNDTTYCPSNILNLYGNKKNFIKKFF